MTNNPPPKGYTHLKATKQHPKTAQNIIFTVLKEYNFSPELQGADKDLTNIESYYDEGYFGLIINELNTTVGAFDLHPLKDKTCKIRNMYLLPEARGKGLGKWRLIFMTAKAKQLGFTRIKGNNPSSLRPNPRKPVLPACRRSCSGGAA